MVTPKRPILAEGYVRHVGNAVAFVVAEMLSQAKDAAELIEIDYEPASGGRRYQRCEGRGCTTGLAGSPEEHLLHLGNRQPRGD